MLQILTGRFFEGKGPLEKEEVEAVLYSNWDYFSNLKILPGELRRTHYAANNVSGYVFQFTNQYERVSPNDPMFLAHADEAVDQFRTICCLWFHAIFHPKRAFVESLLSSKPRFVPGFFDPVVRADASEVAAFDGFLKDLLSLPRDKYQKVVACVRAFCDSIEVVNYNFDIAYSLLVYLLEALSNASDDVFVPTWDDFDEGQRKKIDKVCERIDAQAAQDLRTILTNNQHLKLSKRFVDFVMSHVRDAFFTTEARGQQWTIRKGDLPRLLKNLYTTRSGFVHDLQEAIENVRHLTLEPNCETLRSRHDVFMSYAGLIRLVRHVLVSFVSSAPKLETEPIEWREQLPGIITAEMAPEYWIHKTQGFAEEFAKHRFSGFVAYFMDLLTRPTATMTLLRPIVDLIAQVLPNSKPENQPALVGMFWLYNGLIVQNKAVPDWEKTVDQYANAATTARIEYLAVATLFRGRMRYTGSECESAYREYALHRYKLKAVNLPPRLETGIVCDIANFYLEEGNEEAQRRLLSEAITDMGGVEDIQSLLTGHRDTGTAVDVRAFLGQPPKPEPSAEFDPAHSPARNPSSVNGG